jgi:hypothetical protein
LIFSREVLDRIALYYDNPDDIKILYGYDDGKAPNYSDNADNSSVTNTAITPAIRKKDAGTSSKENPMVADITEITDYNDKQVVASKQDLPSANDQDGNTLSPQKQSVTDVMNITDPHDAKAHDNMRVVGSANKNLENNSNNMDKISNSYYT